MVTFRGRSSSKNKLFNFRSNCVKVSAMNLEALARSGRLGGMVKSEKKLASSIQNARIASQVRAERGKFIPVALCSCSAGISLNHNTSCPLYKKLWYRKKKGLEIIWS
jgi:hypothetical protein